MIDAHHHLWRYSPAQYGWIDDRMAVLRRDYLPGEFVRLMEQTGVAASVVVQARQSIEETEWLLKLANDVPKIVGVVGWLPLRSASLKSHLEAVTQEHLLKGLRHVVQDEPSDDFLLDAEFNRGIELLSETSLTFDLLVRVSQLPATNIFVRRHPHMKFVLDHLAKPAIASGKNIEFWRTQLAQLAECPNVFCKLSGLATEADWSSWTLDQLRPFLDTALEFFGPERLMVGSDWPVCLVATRYERWWDELRAWCAPLDPATQAQILRTNAVNFYSLQQPDEPAFLTIAGFD